MTRKTPEPVQLHLFVSTADTASVVGEASPETWIAEHWPAYVSRGQRPETQAEALLLWVESLRGLASGPAELLRTIAREVSDKRRLTCQLSLRQLARENAISRNTCKRYLDKLLSAGLVTIEPWTRQPCPDGLVLGYTFRLIVDECDAAIAGFAPCRIARKSKA